MAADPIANPSILNNPQTIQQWLNLLEGVTGGPATNTSGSSTNTSTTSNSSGADDPIRALLATLISGATGGINNPQSQALIQSIFTQFKEGANGLSGIQAAGNSAGVYNSSTQGLLANDAMSRAIAQAAGVVGNQQTQQQAIIAQLLNTLSNSTRRTNNNQSGTQNQSQSRGASPGAKAGLGALGAGAAAKGLANLLNKGNQEKFDSKGDQEGDYPQYGQGEGRSDAQDDTSGFGSRGNGIDGDSGDAADPFGIGGYDSEWGDYGSGGLDGQIMDYSGDSNDPFGVGGWDIGDFVGSDNGDSNFSFIDDGGDGALSNIDGGGEGFDQFELDNGSW